MPSASARQHELMEKWFGDPVGDTGPIELLISHGYALTRQWFWRKPVPSHTISEIEQECLLFLMDEWDFGGVVTEGHPLYSLPN